MVYFTSDFHLGHSRISNFRSFVRDSEHNTELLVEAWEKTIKKQDLVFCLGDMAFDKRGLDTIGNLKGRKILLKGNHCSETSTLDQAQVFEEIHGMLRYKKMWLTHCPIHPDEMRRCAGNLTGHIHDKDIMKKTWYGRKVLDKRYLNCCVDAIYRNTGRFFYTLDEAKSYFNI